jgi:hypothetical protein
MTRDEHLQWSKERALEYLDRGEVIEGMTSMMSDLSKHEELANHGGLRIAPMFYGASHDYHAVKRWIEGFN